jgi:hypothetical protein
VRDSILASGTRVEDGEKMVGMVVTPGKRGRRDAVKVSG